MLAFLEQFMGARNRVGIGLPYRPAIVTMCAKGFGGLTCIGQTPRCNKSC
jgi:hypothetical protein